MFESLKPHSMILVTGPQRSGTRLIAKAIAHDTGYTYVDEAEIKVDSVYELYWEMDRKGPSLVVQCPGLCWIAPQLAMINPSIFIVLCMRDEKEIIESQDRINWQWEWLERLRYQTRTDFLMPHKLMGWPVARIKYVVWDHEKRLIPGRYREVQYESLQDHPLWVPKEQRGPEWGFSQTEVTPCS